MKNKTLKNLIALGALAVFVLGFDFASAAVYAYPSSWTIPVSSNSMQDYYQSDYNYSNNYNNYNSNQYGYVQQQSTQQPYYYVQPQVKYVTQPTTTQIQYVPQQTVQYVPSQQTVKYVNTVPNTNSNLGASVVRSNTITTVNKNTGATGNTGQYVSYDANNPNVMLASAYGAYNGQQVIQPQVVNDTNGVTALTVKGSGGFMPSSVFQWFLIVLLILGIIIVARMVSKSFSRDPHGTVAH
ncbi:TPA: hypothetical protein DCX66_03675 [Candidatus Nomurabacteria bacterium]|uniref:Uncharacterized protein n=1 Tax=Candidatus Nomurabacteria bacterium GW2011_GWE1_35_16 TaxID=1618761 RepID=A0A0G0BC50_9BACT|nr:MAG: hypothetical protein UR55_C0001G0013 [Candidatus Nomurabacteria bacterium GW2011_GWF1_34_20]KKP63722.1 MAG: hypothetical protein UR57_C0001G0013 [Candidatus Nomurabacteria bacterium GW2011_GWE2_34_25]KKP66934.1 MAG: hypothetical protein UR64_C0001G0013 [Candidatus Nomurabacteria bacterium GW2011_GWE1_35_16]HAE36759.1 hypothetical protein [Candidatus Nomurabacteria bacterium]HAX65538.1 hypothetical protein [Candidatus Nomurabacteria bacterium]